MDGSGVAPSPIHNGDVIILYCAESSGHIYCEPRSSISTPVTVHPQKTDPPQFPNVHFAAFRIKHVKPSLLNKVDFHAKAYGIPAIKATSNNIQSDEGQGYGIDAVEPTDQDFNLMTTVPCGSTVKLQHIASKKFLTIMPSTPAWLDGDGKENSIFRLLPAKHEKSWGEDIFYGDSLRLESACHKGQRIQCVYNPLTSKYNLVLAVTGSIITVHPHCSISTTVDNNTVINGGQVVTLKWKRIKGFVSIIGSFVSDFLPDELKVTRKSGLRRWREHQWQLRATPSSADTYFQFEKASDPSSGESFQFGECIRIKHILTQKYLTLKIVMKDHVIVLSDFINEDSQIFRLVPDNNERKETEREPLSNLDRVLLVNVGSGRVLSVNARRNLQQKDVYLKHRDPLSQWFDLKFSPISDEQHPFTIAKVDEDGVTDIYFVIGLASLLSKCILKVTSTDFRSTDEENGLKAFNKEIEEQVKQMGTKIQSSVNAKRLANMLRITQVIDAMMVILKYIGTETETVHSISLSICSALKSYAEIANKKSRVRLVEKKFLDILLSLVGKGVDVEEILMALVKDDSGMCRLIKAHLTSNHIRTESLQVLELLRILGYNSNVDVRNKILEKTRQQCEVESFHSKNDIIVALEAFIDQSVNEEATEEYLMIQRQGHTFEFEYLSTDQAIATMDELGNLAKMETRIRNFLKQERIHRLYGHETSQGRNAIILEMLEAVYFLCERNVYVNNEHVPELVKHLTEMLDGSTDSLSQDEEYQGSSRFCLVKVPGNRFVFKIKTQILRILSLLLDQHLTAVLMLILQDFKQLYSTSHAIEPAKKRHHFAHEGDIEIDYTIDEVDEHEGEESGQALRVRLDETMATGREIELNTRSEAKGECSKEDDEPPEILQELLEHNMMTAEESLVPIAQARLRHLYRKSLPPRYDTDVSNQIGGILLDLLDYEDGDIQVECAQFLYDLYSVEAKILNEAERSYFITSYSDNEKQRQMIAVGTITDKDKLLGKMLRLQCEDVSKLTSTLMMFGDWCLDEDDETRANVIIQGVAYSSGLFSIVLEYVLEYGSSDYFDQEEILRGCFYLLRRVARGNQRVQKELFKHFHDFVGMKIAVSSMILLLNEIFSYNSYLCEQLTDLDIQQLFYTMVASSNPEHFELSVTLRAIVESVPTATNLQETISQLLLNHWSDNLGYLLGSDNQVTRSNLLKQEIDNDPELCLLLNISDLLATSTEGECRFAEEVSRKFFPLNELISILIDADVPIHRKLPFARLITWTYLNTERNSLTSCIELANYSELWAHVEHIQVITENIVKMIVEMKPADKRLLQRKLKCLNKLYLTANGWMQISGDINSLETAAGDDEEGTDGSTGSTQQLNALLLYILEGMIPLISAFCTEFALHLSGSSDVCNVDLQKPLTILIAMGDTLVALHKTKVLESSGHLNCIKLCLEGMRRFFILKGIPDENSIAFTILNLKSLNLERNRAFSHNELLEGENPEILLNDTFQVYVENYRRAYKGKTMNSVMTFTGADGAFSGPSFKKIVHLFSDTEEVLRANESPLKVEKLLKLLKTLVRKQKRQGHVPKLEALTVFTLQLLSSVVNEKIKCIPKWDATLFRQYYSDVIFPLQKRLLEKGAAELLVSILQFAREDVAFQVLACLNVLLYCGNEQAQKKISDLVTEESRGVFIRVQQILNTAQSSITQATMTKVVNQFAAATYDPEELDLDDRIGIKILRRNKSAPIAALSTEEDPDSSLGIFSSRRKTAGIEESDIGRMSTSPQQLASIRSLSLIGGGRGAAAPRGSFLDHRITVALNLLSWLCDGQKRNIQDILREQKLFASSSIVSQVAFLFHGVVENLSDDNVAIAQSAVQSLIEMCAGNYENQELAFKGQVIVAIDQILPEGFTSSTTQQMLLRLKCSCIELVEVMVEETSKNSPQLGKWVFSHLTLKNFLFAMKEIWEDYTSLRHISRKEYLLKSVFRAYHVLRRIADYKNVSVDSIVGYEPKSTKITRFQKYFDDGYAEARAMWEHCKFWSRSIEVVYKSNSGEDILTRAYFFFDPHKHLNEHEKKLVLLKIKRNTPEEKLTDLLYWTKAVREYHSWKEKLKKHPIAGWIIKGSTVRHFILFWLTIFLNLLILFSFSVPNDYDPQNGVCPSNENDTDCLYFQPVLKPATPNWYGVVLYVFGSLHLIMSVWMVTQHILKNWQLFTFKVMWLSKLMYKLKKGMRRRRLLYKIARLINRYIFCKKISARFPSSQHYFETSFFSFEPLYRIFFTILSLLGLAVSGYFYCGCMLYIFLKNPVLLFILKAIGKSAKQLLTVFILVLVVIYIYAVITFALLPNYFNPDNDQFCQTLFQCFVTVTRLGLLDTLGSGLIIRPYDSYTPNFTVVGVRAIYDLIFFIIITVLGLNIVIAILVDRFSDLREDREKIEDDNSARCLVCSIPKDAFEGKGLDFDRHWRKDHYVWNYIHYALYLESIQENDYNALEKYIYDQIPNKDKPGSIDFYPLRRAKVLPNYEPN